jgi:hypothetical protein
MFFGKLKINYKIKKSILKKDKKAFGYSHINSKNIDTSKKSHSLLSKKKNF